MACTIFLKLSWRLSILVVVLMAVLLASEQAEAKKEMPMPRRFTFKIDPNTPLKDLLPTPPKALLALPSYLNEDLARVPEATFGEALPYTEKTDTAEQIAHVIAKINHVNQKSPDAFMEALIGQRADLRGLPFLLGKDCRTSAAEAKVFAEVVAVIQSARSLPIETPNPATKSKQTNEPARASDLVQAIWFWEHLREMLSTKFFQKNAKHARPEVERALVAALMQMLTPEPEPYRAGLVKYLVKMEHVAAAPALAKLALFAPEESVRTAAIEGLKPRDAKDYAAVLLQGFRYPLPTVSPRASEALVKLQRKDLLANLVDVLDQPDPRAPAKQQIEGKEVAVVRELVRVNHHRNCVLCHAPGNTKDIPEGVLTGAAPLPDRALASPSEGYLGFMASPDISVRIDVTYLRQDFSILMPVADAKPWPDMQRFDFFVRTRVLTSEEAKACQVQIEKQKPGEAPYHRAVLFALRELTGRDAEPTAQAWRRLLKLP